MNSFTEVIGNYRQGALDEQLAENLREIVAAVIDTGKVGKLTINLKVSPNGDGSVELDADVKAAVPRVTVGKALFYAEADGTLSRKDPRQPDLPLREVRSEATPIRAYKE